MTAKLYIDKGEPLVSVFPQTLGDGSTVWNINLRGGEQVNCIDEKRADIAFELIVKGFRVATGERLLVL